MENREKICPIMSRDTNTELVHCIEEYCMAWGLLHGFSLSKEQITTYGCKLIDKK